MQDSIITPEIVKTAGITIPDDMLQDFLAYVNEQLDERVGEAVAELLDDDQLDSLLELQASSNDEAVAAWIRDNVTDLDQIIEDELSIVLSDIAEERDAINSPI